MNIFKTLTASFLPKRAIGQFKATVTISEIATDTLEITQHPVQQGASITDHAYLLPALVTVNVVFNTRDAPLSETYTKLRKLQSDRVPFTLVTGKRTYRNMMIKSLGQTNDALTENLLSITMDLQEVFITSLELVTVPERSKQDDAATTGATENVGKKQAQGQEAAVTTPRRRSALRVLSGG